MCAPVYFLPASTQIIPVCSVPPDEKELEPTLGLEELFVSTNLVNASVPPICSVAHADVITTGLSPADVAAVAVSAPEVELVSDEVSPLARIIRALLPGSKAIEKIMCPSRSTNLCFFLRPANHGSTHRVKLKACEKVWYV